tara:strand:- start:600 stop:899 length:300 start_codon:yes stop_codon:yes gene_type:complete
MKKVNIALGVCTKRSLTEYKKSSGTPNLSDNRAVADLIESNKSLNQEIERLQDSIKASQQRHRSDIEALNNQLNNSSLVNRNLLELFIVSVGGQPPERK